MAPAASPSATTTAMADDKPSIGTQRAVLYDVPVSNNGARVRLVMYLKGLEDVVEIRSPRDLGGLKSDGYLRLNPHGLMPLLLLPDGMAVYESQVISEYLLDAFADRGPSLTPSTVERRTIARLASRVLDTYISPNQGAMYRSMPAEERAERLAVIHRELDVLEGLVHGPYIAGDELSSADTAVFPTFVFMTYMLPKYFLWKDVFDSRPKLKAWWEGVLTLPPFQRVRDEIEGALAEWDAQKRWEARGITVQVQEQAVKLTY